MSRDFRPTRLIPAANLFGGRLAKYGVREHISDPKNAEKEAREWLEREGIELTAEAVAEWTRSFEAVAKISAELGSRCLTDGTNYLWVYISKRGFVEMITRYGDNGCNGILGAVATEFDTEIIDEEHPQFWEDYEREVIEIPLSEFEVIKGPSTN
jgi:hypothetical protein